MDCSAEDMSSYRLKHESDKEWQMRRAFLVAHREKFSDSRLCCLASCYINVKCYGCRYPEPLMNQLAELTAELPNNPSLSAVRHGLPLPVKFVSAGQSGSRISPSTVVEPRVPGKVSPQACANKSSSNLPHSTAEFSKLETSFQCLAAKLKEMYQSKSLTESRSVTDLVQMAIDKARMSATTQFTELGPGKGFRCDLLLDCVLISTSEAQNKRLAKHNAFLAATELLRKPHLHVTGDAKEGELRLIASSGEKPLSQEHDAGGINTAVHSASAVSKKFPTQSTEGSYMQSGSKRSLDSLHKASLKDFVILQPATTDTNPVSILQQSADFNKWPLEYDVSELGTRCRCRVTLGGQVLSDAVSESKSTAKTAAAEQALKQLATTSCTVCVKKLGEDELEDTLKRSEVRKCCAFLLRSV